MFLRFITRKKDGKEHRYYSVVENVRLPGRRSPFQKTLLYFRAERCPRGGLGQGHRGF